MEKKKQAGKPPKASFTSPLITKSQLLIRNAAHQIHTTESVGTVNQHHQNIQHSFVLPEGLLSDQLGGIHHVRKHSPLQLGNSRKSAQSKLDDELSKIEKMKTLYESRQKLVSHQKHNNSAMQLQRGYEYSREEISSGSMSGSKKRSKIESSKKQHQIKPSNTPSFNKCIKMKDNKKQDEKICKNIYLQEFLSNSQTDHYISPKTKKPKSGIKKQNKCNNKGFRMLQNQQSYNKNQSLEMHELQDDLSLKEQEDNSLCFQTNRDQVHPNSTRQPQQFYRNHNNLQIQQIAQESDETPPKKIMNESSINIDHHISPPQTQLKNIILQLQFKYDNLQLKVEQLFQQNRLLQYKNYQYEAKLTQLQKRQEEDQIHLKKQEKQKQELEIMLKDMLYARQKEKINHSQKSSHRDKKSITTYTIKDEKVLSSKRDQNNNMQNCGGGNNKMKVQNLLQKLQIKVDRV